MKKITIILDPAHGINVPGKCSPDNKHKEYIWSRNFIDNFLKPKLEKEGFVVYKTVENDKEPGLTKRVNIINKFSGNNKILLSLHNNAAGMGDKWYTARGNSIWTSKGKTKSDDYSTIIYYQLKKDIPELKYREDFIDGDCDYEENFTVLMCKCPAILLEWGFQDNKEDLKIIEDEKMNERLANSLVISFIKIDELYG